MIMPPWFLDLTDEVQNRFGILQVWFGIYVPFSLPFQYGNAKACRSVVHVVCLSGRIPAMLTCMRLFWAFRMLFHTSGSSCACEQWPIHPQVSILFTQCRMKPTQLAGMQMTSRGHSCWLIADRILHHFAPSKALFRCQAFRYSYHLFVVGNCYILRCQELDQGI